MRYVIVAASIAAAGVATTLAHTSSTPARTLQAQPVALGAISGTVQDAVSGRPLGGAVVTLRMNVGPSRERSRYMLTDEHGRFVFRDLLPDDGYRISVTRFGYVDGEYGQTAMLGPAGPIALTAGQWFADAAVLLWKPGAISGRVRDEFGEPMVGVYVRALARHHVAGQLDERYLAGTVAMTDDRGEYRLPALPPGTFVVHVPSVQTSVPTGTLDGGFDFGRPGPRGFRLSGLPSLPFTDAALDPAGPSRLVVGNYAAPPAVDGMRQAYPMTFAPGVDQPGAALAVELGPGEERHGVDIVMRPVPAVRIFGTVEGPPEALERLVLRLMPAGLEELGIGGEAATALVAADGRFAFLNVPAGEYVIDAPRALLELTYRTGDGAAGLPQAPGSSFRSARSGSLDAGPPAAGFIRRASPGEDRYWIRTPVSVGTSDITDLVVAVRAGVTLAGRFVYDGSTRMVAVTASAGARGGQPASLGVMASPMARPERPPVVELEPADGAPQLGLPRSNPLDADVGEDRFLVPGLKAGEYVLRVASYGDRFSVKLIIVNGVDYTHRPIDASMLDAQSEVELVLTDQVNTVTGVVRNPSGPTLDAAVIAFPVERDEWSRYGYSPVRIRATMVSGTTGYSMRGLPAGEYFLVAVDRTLMTAWQDPAFLERAAGQASRLTLEWGEAKVVDLDLVRVR